MKPPHCYLAVTIGHGGYWGRGLTIKEAAANVKREGARGLEKCALFLIVGDDKPGITGAGFIVRAPGSTNYKLGVVTLAQALRMESEAL